jgi:L-2-hydroxyglutarate oxidase LhgO
MDYRVDAVVVGAGVVGLAIARALALAGREVLVLERGNGIGQETSSRNSGVIHAGIYYPPDSLKALLCVRGRELLYAFARERGVAHARCGKLVVGSSAESGTLAAIAARAHACGVTDIVELDAAAIREREPAVRADTGFFSPSTGVVDTHQLMLALQADLESAGGTVALRSPVEGGAPGHGKALHRVLVGGAERTELRCRILVNAAGLQACALWGRFAGAERAMLAPAQFLAKGHYYALSGPSPFRHHVYPVPEPGGLGVHATVDLAGNARFGPDVRWTDVIDYRFEDSERERFVTAIRAWFPDVEESSLQPAYTGIRPKISGPGEEAADFFILDGRQHGLRGVCSLHGIESPGLTASLALAELVTHTVIASLA